MSVTFAFSKLKAFRRDSAVIGRIMIFTPAQLLNIIFEGSYKRIKVNLMKVG